MISVNVDVQWQEGPVADIFFHQGAEEEMTIHCFCSRAFVKYGPDLNAGFISHPDV